MYPSNPDSTYSQMQYGTPSPSYSQPPAIGLPVNPNSGQFNYSQPRIVARVPWSTGLCDCFSDVKNCCITCWCPYITFGQIAEIVDHGRTTCGVSGAIYAVFSCISGWACIYSCFFRTKLREQYMLEGSSFEDCLVHCLCETCALCQEYRELQNRGYNMALGWYGNIEQQNRGVAMTPPIAPSFEQGMTR